MQGRNPLFLANLLMPLCNSLAGVPLSCQDIGHVLSADV